MADRSSRAGAANLTIPIVVVVFIIVVVLMNVLGGDNANTATPEGEAPAASAPAAPAASSAVAVTATQLQEAPQQFQGQVVKVSLPVAMPVGTQAFFLDVPKSPFLVKISDALVAGGQAVPTGQVTVEGPLMAMNDSIMKDWIGKGWIPQQDQVLVEFATHFIEARTIQSAPAAAPAP
jgi:hypothetical protein